MVALDEDALICDLWQTYQVHNWRELPPMTVATLACGLSGDSRIIMRLNHQKRPLDTILLAAAVDRLSVLIWQQTRNGRKGHNPPRSIAENLIEKEEEAKPMAFDSVKAFEAVYSRFLGG